MIITKEISIHRIISGTWKHFLLNTITCILTYFIHLYLIPESIEIPVLIPSILGTALAFFIAFNNNQSYNRWWEARKIWGTLTNDSRSWARQLIYFQTGSLQTEPNSLTKGMIYRHISFLYALKQNLRNSSEDEYKRHISKDDAELIALESNKANGILSLQAKDLSQLLASNKIDVFKFIELNKILINFCDAMGGSERISKTVFPTTYNYYTRIFIWMFILFVTLVAAPSIGPWSILIGIFIGYVFLTIHKIGQSLLNPFEEISSGIPLNHITRTIEINMLQTIGEHEVPRPIESSNGEYIM